ncbi:MAG: DNA recombination protein RmuC [Terracidiphilus sp.]|jgi:DNA recombination protein RmuC
MPAWIELVVVLQLAITIAFALAFIFFRGGRSSRDLRTCREKVEQLYELGGKTDSKVDQLTAKHDQFAVTSSQSISNFRAELLAASSTESSNLRQEVVNSITQIGNQIRATLEELRTSTNTRLDNLTGDLTSQQTNLRESINVQLSSFQIEVTSRSNEFQKTQTDQGNASRDAIDGTLSRLSREIREAVNELKSDVTGRINEMAQQTTALRESAESQQITLRQTVEERLDKLNESNTKKLDEMRETVDEKLHKTLETRLTQSFGLVTDQLGKVQTGLGEMKDLAINVGDLKRVLSNVSTRGGLGNTMLGLLLQDMLAPSQYKKEVRIRPNSDERVDYVICLPYSDDEPVLLPVDSKFPTEDWERLEDAAKIGDAQAVAAARKDLERGIKKEAKNIADKYIYPPITTNFAFMYLPSEGLFLEVLRISGLTDYLQNQYHVSIAGPANFAAILNSLQMGFKTLAIQKKSSEVSKLLSATKIEFQNFGVLMTKVEKQVGTVQTTLKEVNSKTRTINRKLRDVEIPEIGMPRPSPLLDVTIPDGQIGREAIPWEAVPELAASAGVELEQDDEENP